MNESDFSVSAYVQKMNEQRSYPRDQWEHGAYLIDSEIEEKYYDKESKEMIMKFSQIADRHIQLCNIGNEEQLKIEKTRVMLLTHMLDMALREDALLYPFRVCYNGWRSGMLTSKALHGKERTDQGAIGAARNPSTSYLAYGEQQQQQQEQEEGFLKQLFNRKKKQE